MKYFVQGYLGGTLLGGGFEPTTLRSAPLIERILSKTCTHSNPPWLKLPLCPVNEVTPELTVFHYKKSGGKKRTPLIYHTNFSSILSSQTNLRKLRSPGIQLELIIMLCYLRANALVHTSTGNQEQPADLIHKGQV